MGEAKRKKRATEAGVKIAKHITAWDDPKEGFKKLGIPTGGAVSVMLIGAGLVHLEVASGGRLLLAEENSTEVHAYRIAFSMWDRIRTGEYSPWQCSLCGVEHHNRLHGLSAFALIDNPREPPSETKGGVVCLVCHQCDSVSTNETRGRVERLFGLASVGAEGHS